MATSVTVPAALIPVMRSALQAQGLSPSIIRDDGTVDPGLIVAAAYDTVEFRSRFSPTIRINTAELFAPNAPTSPVARFASPAMIVTGRGGRYEVAPYGIPARHTGTVTLAALAAGIFGLGLLIGRRT